MAVFPIVLGAFVVFLFLYYYKVSKTRPDNFPPGPPRLPIWGSYWFLLKEDYYFMHKAAEALAKRYKTKVLGLYLGPFPTIVTFGHELCKEVMTREEFYGRPDTIVTRGRSLGELLGVIFTEGPYWKEQRRFSLRHLRDFGFGRRYATTEKLFEKEMTDLIDLITSEPKPEDYDVHRKKGHILAPEIFYAPLMNSILQMLLGQRFESKILREMTRSISKFLHSSDATGGALTITPWLKYIAPDFFGYTPIETDHKRVIEFFKEQIAEHKLHFSDDHHADFADMYIGKMQKNERKEYTNTSFSDKQLLWTLVDYMFPSSVAIGPTIHFLFAYLLNYPEIQVKMQDEIDNVVGRSRLPTLDDRPRMPYTEAVIREALRKDTITPLGIPRTALVDTTLGGYFIPKGTIILIAKETAHHDPKVWDGPEHFRPERFLDDQGNLLKKDLTLSFGAGKRLCAGETFARQVMFLLISGLLQNFTLKPSGEMPDPSNKLWGLVQSMPLFWMEAVSR